MDPPRLRFSAEGSTYLHETFHFVKDSNLTSVCIIEVLSIFSTGIEHAQITFVQIVKSVDLFILLGFSIKRVKDPFCYDLGYGSTRRLSNE